MAEISVAVDKEKFMKLEKAASILNKRYEECDVHGHKKPVKKDNLCNYCYRTLIYKTPEADSIAHENDGVPPMLQTINAGRVHYQAEQERIHQKDMDRFSGLKKIIEELN